MDVLTGCRFYRDLYLWDELAEIIEATTGMKTDKARLQKIASNIRNATRLFNISEGITREDDTLPRRFFEEAIGTDKYVITREELERLKNDYYALRGWNDSGMPVNEVPLDFWLRVPHISNTHTRGRHCTKHTDNYRKTNAKTFCCIEF